MNISIILFALVLFLSTVVTVHSKDCSGESCDALSQHGTPLRLTLEGPSATLNLVSTGMRSKNIVVTKINVYAISIYIPQELENYLKNNDVEDYVSYLSDPKKETTTLAISLKFVRDVGRSTMVSALVDALSGKGDAEYANSLKEFEKLLVSSINDSGLKKTDELLFIWNKNTLKVQLNGKALGNITSESLCHHLAAVYIGKTPIAPEVIDNLKKLRS